MTSSAAHQRCLKGITAPSISSTRNPNARHRLSEGDGRRRRRGRASPRVRQGARRSSRITALERRSDMVLRVARGGRQVGRYASGRRRPSRFPPRRRHVRARRRGIERGRGRSASGTGVERGPAPPSERRRARATTRGARRHAHRATHRHEVQGDPGHRPVAAAGARRLTDPTAWTPDVASVARVDAPMLVAPGATDGDRRGRALHAYLIASCVMVIQPSPVLAPSRFSLMRPLL